MGKRETTKRSKSERSKNARAQGRTSSTSEGQEKVVNKRKRPGQEQVDSK
jgi:hypothetical protein